MLKISDTLSLPIEAVTQKLAFLGRTGSGKSYGATKLCELMLEADAQVIALDPVGVWWGLRTEGNGKGFSIPVFGGLHGDLPLDDEAGATVADLIVDRNISAVLDVSQMLAGEQQRFATDFVTQLFQRKKAAPAAMHLFVEECQEFVPQNVGREEGRMVHAFERLIKLGRNFGIGASLISQRPQEVNKKALNQTECLFAFQMTGPQERKAIESWVSEKGVTDNIVAELPKLRVGEPHVWSPAWLQVSKTVRIAAKRTADVSSTPKLGDRQGKPRALTSVDLEELREQMAATIEEVKENDPEELHRVITRLERDNAKLLSEAVKAAPVSALTDEDRQILDEARTWSMGFAGRLETLQQSFQTCLEKAVEKVMRLAPLAAKADAITQHNVHRRRETTPRRQPDSTRGLGIGKGEGRVLVAIAQHTNGVTLEQLTVLTGYKRSSRNTYLQRLISAELVHRAPGDRIVATMKGIMELGDSFERLPIGEELRKYWLHRLTGGERAILERVISSYPRFVDRDLAGDELGYKRSSRNTYIQRLVARELVRTSGAGIAASEQLFT